MSDVTRGRKGFRGEFSLLRWKTDPSLIENASRGKSGVCCRIDTAKLCRFYLAKFWTPKVWGRETCSLKLPPPPPPDQSSGAPNFPQFSFLCNLPSDSLSSLTNQLTFFFHTYTYWNIYKYEYIHWWTWNIINIKDMLLKNNFKKTSI